MTAMREWMRIVESAADDDADRIFAAYTKKHRIDINDLHRLGDEGIAKLRADAMANHHLYPIPMTEPDYLYHGTAKTRMPQIVHQGLAPQEKSRWTKDGYGGHSTGRVFVTDTVRKAEFYARQASKTQPVVLRVRRTDLADIAPDTREEKGSYFIERPVPPDAIEVWNGKKWAPLRK